MATNKTLDAHCNGSVHRYILNRSISFPGLSSFALLEREGGKMRDPGNEVVIEVLLGSLFAWQEQ